MTTRNDQNVPGSAKESMGRMLIIDDEEPIRIALGRTLRRLGYETVDAPDAEAGLVSIKANDPDIVFLDLRMPGTDGHTFLRNLQGARLTRPPSVIVMSGHGNMDDVIEVMRLGAVDYLRKPWNLTELMSAVTRGLELRKSTEPAPAPAAATTAPSNVVEDERRAARFATLPEKLRRGEIPLPATPGVLTRLRELVADPASSIDDIAAAIEQDPRIAADIFRMANSPVYARLGRAGTVKASVTRLGLRHVHNLVQTISLQGYCEVREGPYRTLLRTIWRRSVARGVCMRALCDVLDPTYAMNADTAYLVGLMADIGASMLLWAVSERAQGNLTAEDVRDVDGVLAVIRKSHEQLAAVLLDSWKFDKVVSVAVAQHHLPAPPVTQPLWWSLFVLGDSLAAKLVDEDDPTAGLPRDRVLVERCAAKFCVPSIVLDRLLLQLREEFESIQGSISA